MHAFVEIESAVTPPAAWTYAMLPDVRCLRVELRASVAQKLPPLITSALHGAFGHALRERACRCPDRRHVEGCLYAELTAPAPGAEAPAGVTTHAPSPVVFAPEDPVTGEPVFLDQGERIAVRVTLIGPARTHEPLVLDALERAAARGLGIGAARSHAARPPLSLVEAKTAPALIHLPSRRVRVRFASPARIVEEGKVQGSIDARRFLVALQRRADLLSRVHGNGAPPALPLGDISTTAVDTMVMPIRRFSARQGRRMVWPGVMGSLLLEGESLSSLTPLLAFGAAVQIGKGTTFGFGRFLVDSQG